MITSPKQSIENNEFCLSNLEISHITHGNEIWTYNTFKHMKIEEETLPKHILHESHHNSFKLCLLVPSKIIEYTSVPSSITQHPTLPMAKKMKYIDQKKLLPTLRGQIHDLWSCSPKSSTRILLTWEINKLSLSW